MTQSELMDEEYAERKERLAAALRADTSNTISADKLSAALGIPRGQLANAAWEGTCPFGWGHRGENTSNRRVTFYKDKVWSYFYGPAVVNPAVVRGRA